MENEVWKDIKGYEGKYQISNTGKVKILKSNSIMKCSKARKYYKANLYKNKKIQTIHIHRLVAQAFVPNHNNYPCVNHIDGNIYNNNANNLEWCTYKYNNNYGTHELKRKITSLIVEIKKYDNDEKIIQILQNYYKKL